MEVPCSFKVLHIYCCIRDHILWRINISLKEAMPDALQKQTCLQWFLPLCVDAEATWSVLKVRLAGLNTTWELRQVVTICQPEFVQMCKTFSDIWMWSVGFELSSLVLWFIHFTTVDRRWHAEKHLETNAYTLSMQRRSAFLRNLKTNIKSMVEVMGGSK